MRVHIKTIVTGSILALFAVGCGPKAPPKTAKDVNADAKAVKLPPKRQISTEVKADFRQAVAKYTQAKKSGITAGNCSGLASAFAEVYAASPKLVESKFNEGVVWEECGQVAKAEKVYQEILKRHPKHGPTLNNLGQIYFKKGQSGAALSYFQRAAAAKNSEGYGNLAMLQRERAMKGDTESLREAVNNIHRALAVDSFNIEAYNTLATLLYDHSRSQSQLEMARLICVQATKVDPKFAPVYNVLGLILLKMGRVTPALAEFRKAVERDPNFKDALMNIGAVTLSFRDYTSAERSFRKVLGLSPSKQMKLAATVGLGVALRGLRKFDEAIAQYRAAEKIDPSNADISYNIGILLQDYKFDASDPAKGIVHLHKVVTLLNKYTSGARDRSQLKDAKRRLKNIREMIPMLREQQKMMQSMKK